MATSEQTHEVKFQGMFSTSRESQATVNSVDPSAQPSLMRTCTNAAYASAVLQAIQWLICLPEVEPWGESPKSVK